MWKPEQEFPPDTPQEESVARDTSASDNYQVKVAEPNWKASLKFSKMSSKPEKWWKKELPLSRMRDMPWKNPDKKVKGLEKPEKTTTTSRKTSLAGKSTPLRRTPLKRSQKPLKKTPLAPIWKKKKERLASGWSEVTVFLQRWESWDQCCEVCLREGKSRKEALVKDAFMNGRLIKPQCFPHILSKWLYPQFRLLVENIWLVCGILHHDIFDSWHREQEVRNGIEARFNEIIAQKWE